MIDRLAATLAERPPRERLLLALFCVAVLPLAFVLLVADPLVAARDAARAERARAEALVEWYRQTQTVIARLPASHDATGDRTGDPAGNAPATQPDRAAVGLAGIEAQLVDAGLRAQTTMLTADGSGALVLSMADADFAVLMDWLAQMRPGAGYAIGSLALEPGGAPGLVNGDLRLVPLD